MTIDQKGKGGPVMPFTFCGAKTRAGGTCKQPAMVGMARCRLHGGKNPSAMQAVARRRADKDARKVIAATWGGVIDVPPAQALITLVQTKSAEVSYWNLQVESLNQIPAGLFVTGTENGIDRNNLTNLETRTVTPHIYLVMLHKAQDQLAQYAAAAVRVGVDEALVKLAVMQGDTYLEFGRQVALAAGVAPDQVTQVLRAAIGVQNV